MLTLALAAIAWLASARKPAEPAPIGLFTSLPIMWAETADMATLLDDKAPPHWAREALAGRGRIVALDALAGPAGHGSLDPLRRLVIAQPRPLGPQENVALDGWVRNGGKLLLLVDPALTEESAFPLGDPRRPQAVALLSPILARWGLQLTFDEAQPFGDAVQDVQGLAVTTNLPGRFVATAASKCRLSANRLLADCAIGKGRVVALADASVLERNDPSGARRKAFAGLLDLAFSGR